MDNCICCGDCLDVMREKIAGESVDLIYLDPPFNSGRDYGEFGDEWKDMGAYLRFMRPRLVEMRRVLKPTGSIYLHCDPAASHYLKIAMDKIFGKKSFRNEIVWFYSNASRGKKQWAKSHDTIFWYAKSEKGGRFNREDVLVPFQSGMTEWRYAKGGQAGKPAPKGKTPDDVISMPSLNAMAKERVGYPTQKPLALLEKIILASSVENDLVLDPFCGCGTTIRAAQKLGRNWIGIDINPTAIALAGERMAA